MIGLIEILLVNNLFDNLKKEGLLVEKKRAVNNTKIINGSLYREVE